MPRQTDDEGAYIPTPEELKAAIDVEWQKHLKKKLAEVGRGLSKRLPKTVPHLNFRRGVEGE